MKGMSEVPEKPLVAGVHQKVEGAKPIFFFEREDGTTFFAGESEAWSILKGRAQVLGRDRMRVKYLGCSDGEAYRKAVIESQGIFRTQGLEKAQERLRQGELEELERAKGNRSMPRNHDTITSGGQPINLSQFR